MKVIVDTCIWSLVLRRKNAEAHHIAIELQKLIDDSRVQMLGSIRQELLSGIASPKQFINLKNSLSAYPDLLISTENYETAAEYSNTCRAKGIQGSMIDYLICAAASHYQLPIFTVDNDFKAYARHVPIVLYIP